MNSDSGPNKSGKGRKVTRPQSVARKANSRRKAEPQVVRTFDFHQRTAGWGLVLIIATILAYLPALNAGWVWDDDNYVTTNPMLHSLEGLKRIWTSLGATAQYYPLVFTSFWLEYQLWGVKPFGYHLVNVLLHCASVLVLWRLLVRFEVPGALFVAALFAVHPVEVESVAWVTERKNVLSGVFYLLSLTTYLRWMGLTPNRKGEAAVGGWRGFAITTLLFVAALLSKTVTCTMPAAALVIVWWKRSRLTRTQIVSALVLLLIGASIASVTVYVERHIVGTGERGTGLSFIERLSVAGRAFWFYLGKVVWPAGLTFIYPKWNLQENSWIGWLAVSGFAALVAVTVAMRHRIGRGPLCLVLLYAGTLAPALGFVDVFPFEYSYVADHFQYLASIAPLCAVGICLQHAATRFNWNHNIRVASGSAVVCILAFLTFRQAGAYENAETLWRDTIAKNPHAIMARSNLGQILMRSGRASEAEKELRAALDIDPNYPIAHFNLGALLLDTERPPEGTKHLEEAARLDPGNARMQYHIGLAMQRHGNLEQAIAQFERASNLKRGYVDPLNDWGNVLARQGKLEEAAEKYRQVLTMKPDYVLAHANLANALAGIGDDAGAKTHYDRALALDPANAGTHFSYAMWLEKQGDNGDALRHYDEAIKFRPGWDEARQRADALRSTARQ